MQNVEIQLIQWLNTHAPTDYKVSAVSEYGATREKIITVERLSGQRTRHVDVALIGIDVWGGSRAVLARVADRVADLLYEFEDDANNVSEVFLQLLGYQPYVSEHLTPRYHLLVQITSSVGA